MAGRISECDINGAPSSVFPMQKDSLTGGIISQIGRRPRLCLFAAGPVYAPNYYVGSFNYRSVGGAYYAECSTRLVFATATISSVKGRTDTIRTHVVKKLGGEACEESFLVPANYRLIARIIGDVLPFALMAAVRRNCMDYLSNNGEFRALRHDGAYKALKRPSGQPRHGASVRKYAETSVGGI